MINEFNNFDEIINPILLIYRRKIHEFLCKNYEKQYPEFISHKIISTKVSEGENFNFYFNYVKFSFPKDKEPISIKIILMIPDDYQIYEKSINEFVKCAKIHDADWQQQADHTPSLYLLTSQFPLKVKPLSILASGNKGILFSPILCSDDKEFDYFDYVLDDDKIKNISYVIARFHGIKNDKTDFIRYKEHLIRVSKFVNKDQLGRWRNAIKEDSRAAECILGNSNYKNFIFTEDEVFVLGSRIIYNGDRMEDLGNFIASIISKRIKKQFLLNPEESTKNVVRDVSRTIITETIPRILQVYLQTVNATKTYKKLSLLDFFIGNALLNVAESIDDEKINKSLSAMGIIFAQEAPGSEYYDKKTTLTTQSMDAIKNLE